MVTNAMSSGVAGALVSAPSAGDTLRFAAYVVDLIGSERVGHVSVDGTKVHLIALDTLALEAAVHLLSLQTRRPRVDVEPQPSFPEGYSAWWGTSGPFDVHLSAPLALGALPKRAPRDWSAVQAAA